jgi:hypothetical protein
MEKSSNPIVSEGCNGRPFLGHIGAFAFQLADHVSKPRGDRQQKCLFAEILPTHSLCARARAVDPSRTSVWFTKGARADARCDRRKLLHRGRTPAAALSLYSFLRLR